jgi:hypothetical protein
MTEVFDGPHVAGRNVAGCADECKVFHGLNARYLVWGA